MKTIARLIWPAAVLGALVFLAGCATPQAAAVRRAVPLYDFTVVEGSLARELTSQEIAQVRETVEKYLAAQGAKPGGQYYVRVNFTPEMAGEPVDWVVVKLNLAAGQAYAVGAAYPAESPYYSPLDYRYGYPYGYDYSAYSYYDPFGFNYGYYHYPRHHRDRKPGDRDDRDDGDNRGRGTQAGDDRRPRDKDDRPRDRQVGNDGRPAGDPRNRTAGNTPRTPDTGRRRDEGPGGSPPRLNNGGSGGGSGGVVRTPPPSTPPPARAAEPTNRTASTPNTRERGGSADKVLER